MKIVVSWLKGFMIFLKSSKIKMKIVFIIYVYWKLYIMNW